MRPQAHRQRHDVSQTDDFDTRLSSSTIGPPPAGTDVPTNGWERRTEEFKEGGVVATDDTLYTGLRLRGHQRVRAQRVHEAHADPPRRAGRWLGQRPGRGGRDGRRADHDADTGAGRGRRPAPVPAAQAPAEVKPKALRASAKLKSAKTLRVNRKRAASVRVNCAGDTGAVCRGTVELLRGKTKLGTKKFAVQAGKTATVKVRVKHAPRRSPQRSSSASPTSNARLKGQAL